MLEALSRHTQETTSKSYHAKPLRFIARDDRPTTITMRSFYSGNDPRIERGGAENNAVVSR